jgi:hypothetical protein
MEFKVFSIILRLHYNRTCCFLMKAKGVKGMNEGKDREEPKMDTLRIRFRKQSSSVHMKSRIYAVLKMFCYEGLSPRLGQYQW